jgi:flavin reductase (DIM6/NTAB) family NADH-FMN oxidoreductase RutF
MAGMDAFIDRLDPDMCVVTAAADGDRAGCLVGFACQCSIEPVRYAVWLSKANRTYRVARAASRLAVHLLTREQRGLAELFGGETGDRTDKFARARWREEAGGAVVLEWGAREDTDGAPLLRLSDAASISPGHPAD